MNSTLHELAAAGTAVIADVIDAEGRTPAVLDNHVASLVAPGTSFAGPAYTVTGESHRWVGSDRAKLAAIDGMTPGVVGVWAGNDIRGVCCFGDLLGSAMKARGCAGVVVDGGVRDTSYLRTLGLPIMSRYRTPAQAIGRWRVTAHQTVVKVRGALEDWITVYPGDLVVGDDDGVIVVPADSVETVVTRVREWSRSESEARKEIIAGLPLLDALAKYGHL